MVRRSWSARWTGFAVTRAATIIVSIASRKSFPQMMERDPIQVLAQELCEAGELTTDEWETMQREIDEQVDRDYRQAENAPDPDPARVLEHLWGESVLPKVPPLDGGRKMRMVDAMNTVFHRGMDSNRKFVFFGEDIEDPKGGVFRLDVWFVHPSIRIASSIHRWQRGRLPALRVAWPAWECGLCLNCSSSISWDRPGIKSRRISRRSAGGPAANGRARRSLYAPYGAYLPGGGLWHSQANESLFAHVPGLRVVVPSTPEDAAGLLWTAMHGDDPTFVLVPKHLIRQPVDVPAMSRPFRSARHDSADRAPMSPWSPGAMAWNWPCKPRISARTDFGRGD